jgi:DNA-binding NtrC family response regulator
VDDEPLVRDMLTLVLRRENYKVFNAPSAEAALGVLEAGCVGAILVDRNLPGRNGDWLIAQVKERFPATAIILATGEYVPPSVSLQRGVVGFLGKPFTADAVRSAVSDAMLWHQVASRKMRA